MFEAVSKFHPDKIADRIAGAIVDLSYAKQENPKVACEVLIGHGTCHIINETSVRLSKEEIAKIVYKIAGNIWVDYEEVPQDEELAKNQKQEIRCGDNGIFKGVPLNKEQKELIMIRGDLEKSYPSDGKYILDQKSNTLIICQSNAKSIDIRRLLSIYDYDMIVNPLGPWTGGTNVDCGATNRKLGSDMADSITGGGLHGKDLSKADVAVNIYCFKKAQQLKKTITAYCAIGNTEVNVNGELIPYKDIVEFAANYIKIIGGFEKLAEHGLCR